MPIRERRWMRCMVRDIPQFTWTNTFCSCYLISVASWIEALCPRSSNHSCWNKARLVCPQFNYLCPINTSTWLERSLHLSPIIASFYFIFIRDNFLERWLHLLCWTSCLECMDELWNVRQSWRWLYSWVQNHKSKNIERNFQKGNKNKFEPKW